MNVKDMARINSPIPLSVPTAVTLPTNTLWEKNTLFKVKNWYNYFWNNEYN